MQQTPATFQQTLQALETADQGQTLSPMMAAMIHPPQLNGGETVLPTPMRAMRRQQLVDLAKAYNLPNIPIDGTKEEMLIGLIAAEQAGTFRKSPVSPAHFACAMRSSDDPVIVNDDGSPSPVMGREMEWPVDHPKYGRPQEAADEELEALRAKAAELGALFHHKAGVEKLRGIVAAAEKIAELEKV